MTLGPQRCPMKEARRSFSEMSTSIACSARHNPRVAHDAWRNVKEQGLFWSESPVGQALLTCFQRLVMATR